MADLTDFFGSGGGGGLTPKFQEFNSSGTFTPSASLIGAGGYIEVFLVGGGGKGGDNSYGANGGEALFKKMYLTSVSAISVSIGAGATGNTGGGSSFNGSSAGGVDVTAIGGTGGYTTAQESPKASPSWGGYSNYGASGNGVFGYGAGGGPSNGIRGTKPNTGQGSINSGNGGSGYCLIKWYE